MPILIIEDDGAIRRGIVDAVRFAGYAALEAGDARKGMDLAVTADCALVLLDLVLPGGDGLEILRRVRATRPTLPVIILTARGEEADRVRGLELGADDYVVKPFSVRELLLRVQSVLRRSMPAAQTSAAIEFGPVRVDRDAHRVWVHGEEAELTALEFKLLATFMSRVGRLQTRGTLLRDVWGVSGELQTRTVDTHVKRLREKLGLGRDLVETVRGSGYRMIDPGEN